MNQLRKSIITLLSICLYTVALFAQKAETQLLNNWELSKADKDEWIGVVTPVSVHAALYKAKKIPDPFIGNAEDSLQWIGEADWKFRTSFNITREEISFFQYELVFEGLDTYAEVRLNGKPLLKANNMFRSWHNDIKKFIVVGKNIIEIRFTSPTNYINKTTEPDNIKYPGGDRAMTRKAQYQFGWDWAPTYITMGICKPVYIKRWQNASITDMKLSYELYKDYAQIQFYGKFKVNKPDNYRLVLNISDSGFDRDLSFQQDTELLSTSFRMYNIERWWPNGMGDHTVYVATLKLMYKDELIDKVEKLIGFRSVEVITEKDSIGESMYFKVNGKPMYAKGANYVPPSSFPDQVKGKKQLDLIKDAQDCNFNMLRVWGGGYYETDEFYSLCDYAGILVWQDFMFACAMYPGDQDFLDNVMEEAKENVNRIGGHPCIALWCGNNEISEGWARWGWKDGFNAEQAEYLDKAYKDIFKNMLSKEVIHSKLNLNYLESSPLWGRGDERYKKEGDAHDWWVWHDARPFEQFEVNVPRFMSEFGFQSYPDLKTIKAFAGKNMQLNDKSLMAHQKHNRGNELIQTYMDREYPKPKDFESFVYLSQRLQAEGIGRGIVAQRLSMPRCMGSLYWQYNDCWPAISWSSVDYYGRWKAMQYKAKRLYAPVLVASKIIGDIAESHIVSENDLEEKFQLNLQVYTLKGVLLKTNNRICNVKPNASAIYQNTKLKEYIDQYGKENLCIYTSIRDSLNQLVSEDFDFLVNYKELNIEKNALKVSVTQEKYGYSIKLNATAIVPGIWISSSLEGKFSDNGFDMIPGEKEIKFDTNSKSSQKTEFAIRSLRDAWE